MRSARVLDEVTEGDEDIERAASLLRALGEAARLRLLAELDRGERTVTDLAAACGSKLTTMSQQLRVLHTERIVVRRRDGKYIFYSVPDERVHALIRIALERSKDGPDPS